MLDSNVNYGKKREINFHRNSPWYYKSPIFVFISLYIYEQCFQQRVFE